MRCCRRDDHVNAIELLQNFATLPKELAVRLDVLRSCDAAAALDPPQRLRMVLSLMSWQMLLVTTERLAEEDGVVVGGRQRDLLNTGSQRLQSIERSAGSGLNFLVEIKPELGRGSDSKG